MPLLLVYQRFSISCLRRCRSATRFRKNTRSSHTHDISRPRLEFRRPGPARIFKCAYPPSQTYSIATLYFPRIPRTITDWNQCPCMCTRCVLLCISPILLNAYSQACGPMRVIVHATRSIRTTHSLSCSSYCEYTVNLNAISGLKDSIPLIWSHIYNL